MNEWYLVGLGNPGLEYKVTRHNLGALFVEWLANSMNNEDDWAKKKFCLVKKCFHENIDYHFILPTTYMNESGKITQNINLNPAKTIVFHDDLEVPFGKFKIRFSSNRGLKGHNGLRSIVQHLKNNGHNEQPLYVSLGIGRPSDDDVASFVLNPFSKSEQALLNQIFSALKTELTVNLKV